MNENQISAVIVDGALEVHRTLGGPGLLESVYRDALMWELRHRNVSVEREKKVPMTLLQKPLNAESAERAELKNANSTKNNAFRFGTGKKSLRSLRALRETSLR